MAYLIGQLTWWLLLVGLLAGAAGWAWNVIRSAPHLQALERERDRLRGELLNLGATELAPGARSVADDRERDVMHTRETILTSRVRELEQALAEARDQRERAAGRVAEMQRLIDHSAAPAIEAHVADDRSAELEAEIARLRAQAAAAEPGDALTWRLRYFEARMRYLENQARKPARGDDASALAALEAERDATRAEAASVRGQAMTAAPASSDEIGALKWRARYLEARVRYLEGRSGATEAPASAEAAQRRVWRMHYLETRARRLQRAPAGGDAAALEAARARIAELETAQNPEADPTRLRWRARYLDARVQHLESRLGDTSSPVAPAPEPEAALPIEPPPLVPAGSEVRPAALGAPRNGAPDDLRLIGGVGPKTETSLNALGIHHFDQIADWSRANVAWVDQYLRLRGRIVRERWVEQAKELARGEQTSHRRRYLESELA